MILFKIYISKSLKVTNRRRPDHRIRMDTLKNSLLPQHHSLQSIVTLLANWRHMSLSKLRWKGKLPKMNLVHRTRIGSSRMRTRKWFLIEHNFLRVVYAESHLYLVLGKISIITVIERDTAHEFRGNNLFISEFVSTICRLSCQVWFSNNFTLSEAVRANYQMLFLLINRRWSSWQPFGPSRGKRKG